MQGGSSLFIITYVLAILMTHAKAAFRKQEKGGCINTKSGNCKKDVGGK